MPTELTITKQDAFHPIAVMTIYMAKEEKDYMKKEKLYVESALIDEEGRIGAAQPLSIEAAKVLATQLNASIKIQSFGGIMPENVLRLDYQNTGFELTWWTAAQQVSATYSGNLKIPNGKIWVPAMVWNYDLGDQALKVFALIKSERPTEKTKIYHAPFHNVYGDGRVCIGTGAKHFSRANNYTAIMKSVEKVFWGTSFSEIHNTAAAKKNLNTLHHQLVTEQIKFPLEHLKQTNGYKIYQ